MEESEQRRERLKAMRIEAAGAAADAGSGMAASGGLSNPLVEDQSTSTSTPSQYFSPRFDYYTDPMAAFSGTRRRDTATPHPRPTYQDVAPGSGYQTPGVNSPDQRISEVPGAQFNQRPHWRPMELATPPDAWGGPGPGPGRPFNNAHPSGRPLGNPPGSWGAGPGCPFNNAYPYGRPPYNNPPNNWGGPGGAFNYPTPSNMSIGRNFSNPSYGQEGSYYGRGRGQRYNSSSHYESARGGRGWSPSSPGSRTSGRRGGSHHESVSAELRPELYYRKEMVEDPWKMLTPVIWKDAHAGDTDKSWLPKSITMKRTKVSSESPQTSISQQSLAEYLSSSFNDSTDEPALDELGT